MLKSIYTASAAVYFAPAAGLDISITGGVVSMLSVYAAVEDHPA